MVRHPSFQGAKGFLPLLAGSSPALGTLLAFGSGADSSSLPLRHALGSTLVARAAREVRARGVSGWLLLSEARRDRTDEPGCESIG